MVNPCNDREGPAVVSAGLRGAGRGLPRPSVRVQMGREEGSETVGEGSRCRRRRASEAVDAA